MPQSESSTQGGAGGSDSVDASPHLSRLLPQLFFQYKPLEDLSNAVYIYIYIFVLPKMNTSLRILDSEVFGGTQSLSRRRSGTRRLAALWPVLPCKSSPHYLQRSRLPEPCLLPWMASAGAESGSHLHPVCSQTVSVVDQCIHGLFL